MANYNQSLGFPMGLRIQNLDTAMYADLSESNAGLGATQWDMTGGGAQETYLDTLRYFSEMNGYVENDFTGSVIWADTQQPTLDELWEREQLMTETSVS